ncbi:MAG TPA: hypothetical protein VN778_05675, partial [Verrucomicrobiae bacterium]|nr:hypothetical protein [Verrucomicrobiae bacterium]
MFPTDDIFTAPQPERNSTVPQKDAGITPRFTKPSMLTATSTRGETYRLMIDSAYPLGTPGTAWLNVATATVGNDDRPSFRMVRFGEPSRTHEGELVVPFWAGTRSGTLMQSGGNVHATLTLPDGNRDDVTFTYERN